ncbi:hypothetical protein [Parasitella parasitica]|uniref:DNA replication checkpoint mediator MRC1 domain-containing protein n=1 Tax=Parasitella parasitica TaxID=35722 RepID=A0A0B7N6D8_9FUNG|nr:hypothetical protein [Parasitella parasitica]
MDVNLKTNAAEDSEDERPLFEKPTYLTTTVMETDDDDDDDDLGSSSLTDSQYASMNISSHLKNILSYDTSSRNVMVSLDDESDSDMETGAVTAAAEATVDLDKLNAEIDRYKFANFPLKPADAAKDDHGSEKPKKARKPKEKKKRRDKGKKKASAEDDALEAEERARSKKFDKLLQRFAQEAESSEDEQMPKAAKSKKKSSGRKTRKKTTNEITLDENGEQMMRTTEILDATSSSSSEDERKLSKKEEIEMYRDAERQRRAAKVLLKPVYHYKSFDDLAKRREENDQERPHQDVVITHKAPKPHGPPSSPRLSSSQHPTFNFELSSDSDSDIEITDDPKKIAAATYAAMLSPERPRVPVAISPARHAATAMRNHNRFMLHRISNEGYDYRIKMEQAAKARGHYASATERARRLIEKEKDAMMINDQINRHFEKKKHSTSHDTYDDDDDEDDGDFEDQDDEKEKGPLDDILNELSGSEEEEDEFLVQDAQDEPNPSHKRKNASDNENNGGEDDDEEDMAAMAFKRWKGKKVKKSTIFDDEDQDEEQTSKKKKVAAKPAPAHSISNFFKAKEAKMAEEVAEQNENKPLSRLVRRSEKEPSSLEIQTNKSAVEQQDAMDVDQPAPTPTPIPAQTVVSALMKKRVSMAPLHPEQKLEYLEEEAVEEEDEFFGAGGSDGETGENLDEFEKDDLLVEDNNEHIDEAALREAFNLQDKETDSNMIQRLITDITSGNLRKQKAALEAGLMLDDIDLYDEEDNDLVAIRRAAAAKRRKLLKKKGGDILENMLSDPKTAAFAKAAQAMSEEMAIAVFSESEGEAEEEGQEDNQQYDDDYEKSTPLVSSRRVIVEDDEDDEDEDEDEDQEMKDVSDDENLLIVDEFDTMTSPIRATTTEVTVGGGLASGIRITSADDEDVDFQIETMKSPINVRKATSLYGSPGTLERFKRLIAETSSASNGTSSDTGGPRAGFSSLQQKQQNEAGGKPKLTGSLGELFIRSNGKESKLKKLKSQSSSMFQYAE